MEDLDFPLFWGKRFCLGTKHLVSKHSSWSHRDVETWCYLFAVLIRQIVYMGKCTLW